MVFVAGYTCSLCVGYVCWLLFIDGCFFMLLDCLIGFVDNLVNLGGVVLLVVSMYN